MSHIQKNGIELHLGHCLDVLKTLPENSVDSVVTDPPAGISFMNKKWDANHGSRDRWIDWLCEIMVEVVRVLKPGGHALVWALPRTSHWTAMACENAGFEIRDRVSHLFGHVEKEVKNTHPTVKPQVLMEWLIKLITPPGGVVLDCFAGSCLTGVAAQNLGLKAILIEREQEYFDIGCRRLGISRES